MDDKNDFRGWDLYIDGDRIAAHIINKWPSDALKVIGQTQMQPRQWYHLFVTYDGSSKAGGVKLYVNGKPEPVQVAEDKLKSTTKTAVPFKIGPRHTTSPIENVVLQDVRIYDRNLTGWTWIA